jgi:hypothetical protein
MDIKGRRPKNSYDTCKDRLGNNEVFSTMKKNRVYIYGVILLLVFFALGCSSSQESASSTVVTILKDDAVKEDTNIDEHTKRYSVAGIKKPKDFEDFYKKLQNAVKVGSKEEVADCITYPFHLYELGKIRETYATKEAFLANYDAIFNEKVKNAFINQDVKDTFINYQGVMVGRGEIWLGPTDKLKQGYRILTVNN